ncbi:MAG: hypothetical protein EBR23_15085, partial [Planctomycetia bacterium]|nr:hypothetical protein [Planctomycetia bacterium]
ATILRTTRFMYWITNTVFAAFVLAAGVATTFLVSLAPDLAAQLRTAAGVYAAWTVARTPLTLYGDALYATQNVALASMTTTLGVLLRLAVSILLVWAGFGLVGLTVAAVLSEFLAGLANYVLFVRLHPEIGAISAGRDGALMKRMLSFGSTYLINTVSNQLATNTSGLVFGHLFDARAVSVAYTSQMPASVLGQTIWKLSHSAGPAFTQLHAQSDQAGLRRTYLTLLRSSLACGLPLAVGLLAVIGLGGMMVVAMAIQGPILAYTSTRVHHLLGVTPGQVIRESLLRPIVIAACCAAFIGITTTAWPLPHDWPSLLGWTCAYSGTWAALCWGVGCTSRERTLIQAGLQQHLRRWAGQAGAA